MSSKITLVYFSGYLSLVRFDDRWLIVSKTITHVEPGSYKSRRPAPRLSRHHE